MPGGEAVFQLASADGSRVFFTDPDRLTAGSGAETPGKTDLYECAVVESEAGGLECELTDLTPEASGEAAAVQGDVIGASEDGSYLYFVANGALTGPEENAGQRSRPPRPGQPLPSPRRPDHLHRRPLRRRQPRLESAQLPASLTARVSPDGRWLAFMSQRSLTGYDNRDAAARPTRPGGLPLRRPAGRRRRQLRCASCNPTGARPHGLEYEQIGSAAADLADLGSASPKTAWSPPTSPAGPPTSGENGVLYQPRYLSDSGRLFFNAADALVPAGLQRHLGRLPVRAARRRRRAPPGDTCALASPTYSPASRAASA